MPLTRPQIEPERILIVSNDVSGAAFAVKFSVARKSHREVQLLGLTPLTADE